MSNRESIPRKVKEILRSEVGFGCPVKECGNPYLEYHHFDPPVSVRAHNNPEGMIALCAQHHKKADGGAYTNEQLHELKKDQANADFVKGDLEWLRRDLLAVVGGNYYYETSKIIVVDGFDLVSLVRDDEGYLRLNVNLLSLAKEDRVVIKDNSWERIGIPLDLRSPPQGKELEVRYHNGDYIYLKFYELNSAEIAIKKYGSNILRDLMYPITVVEVNLAIGGTNIKLTPKSSTLGGLKMVGNFVSNCGGGVVVNNSGYKWRQNSQ